MVQKDISTWISKPLQFNTVECYLDIINILYVYGDKHTITLPINIAKDNLYVTLHVNFNETSATMQFHIEMDKSWNIPKKLIPQPPTPIHTHPQPSTPTHPQPYYGCGWVWVGVDG